MPKDEWLLHLLDLCVHVRGQQWGRAERERPDVPIVNISPPSSIRISTTVSYVYDDGFAPERFKEIPVELSVTMQGTFRLFTSSCVSYDTSINVPGSSVGGGA